VPFALAGDSARLGRGYLALVPEDPKEGDIFIPRGSPHFPSFFDVQVASTHSKTHVTSTAWLTIGPSKKVTVWNRRSLLPKLIVQQTSAECKTFDNINSKIEYFSPDASESGCWQWQRET
jgi:hypothetical protein